MSLSFIHLNYDNKETALLLSADVSASETQTLIKVRPESPFAHTSADIKQF
jgi:hypothetical protein